MASTRAFLDPSGFYALLVNEDRVHPQAAGWLQTVSAQRPILTTTDLVLNETATLLKARGYRHVVKHFFDLLAVTKALQICWLDPALFAETQTFFLKHEDHDYSFADCASFLVMRRSGLSEALTTDRHFREAGFVPLLPTA